MSITSAIMAGMAGAKSIKAFADKLSEHEQQPIGQAPLPVSTTKDPIQPVPRQQEDDPTIEEMMDLVSSVRNITRNGLAEFRNITSNPIASRR